METEIQEVEAKISQALGLIREAINISVELKSRGPEADKQICRLWERFLGEFFGYIRQKSRETRQNILKGITFPRF